MSGLTDFAIFGLGRLGSCILTSLLESPAHVSLRIRILTRPGSKRMGRYPENVIFQPIDYSDPVEAEAQLIRALRGTQVVISTVGSGVDHPSALARKLLTEGKHSGYIPGYANQAIVARAAKKVGCRLFVPAEYGSPTHWLDPDSEVFTRGKRIFHLELIKMGLPYTLFYTGLFINPDPPRVPLPENTLDIGVAPFSTSRHHASQFLVHVLLNVSLRQMSWGIYMIRGLRREMIVNGKWEQFQLVNLKDDLLAKWLSEVSLEPPDSEP